MYEFAKEFVVCTAFGIFLAMDVFGIGYWIYTFGRWLKKRRHRDKAEK